MADIPGTAPDVNAGGGLKTKIMGMPAYMWVAIAAVGGAAFLLWRRGSGGADGGDEQQPPAGYVPPQSDETEFMGDEERYQTLLAQLRDLQGSVSTKIPTPAGTTTTPPATTPPKYPAASTAGVKPAAGSHRGYGWYRVVKGDSAKKIADKYKIPLALYYSYNGPARIVAGQYVKVRLTSNPVTGPYYGH